MESSPFSMVFYKVRKWLIFPFTRALHPVHMLLLLTMFFAKPPNFSDTADKLPVKSQRGFRRHGSTAISLFPG